MTTFDDDPQADQKTNISDVMKWSSQFIDTSMGGSTYLVYWGGDWGCAGGSGTYSSFLTEIGRSSDYRSFIVQQHDVLDESGINSRFIEEVSMEDGNLKIVSSDYADKKYGGVDSGNNFPANKFEYILKQTDNGLKVVRKKLIQQNL